VTEPEWNGPGDVFGCGLLMSPQNKLSIFFTENGILIGQFICVLLMNFYVFDMKSGTI
jgi:hypothetical protein